MSSHADTGGGFIVHGGGWIMRADLSDGEPALPEPLLPKDCNVRGLVFGKS